MSRREASVATQANTPSQERDPLGRLTRIFAGILGLVFLLLGLGLCIREIHFGGTAQPAAGTIAEVRVKESADGPDYYPVVEFKTAEGRVVRFEGISTSPAPVAGTPIRVLYNPADPEQARINTYAHRWLFPTVFTPIGLVLLLGAWFWRNKRHA